MQRLDSILLWGSFLLFFYTWSIYHTQYCCCSDPGDRPTSILPDPPGKGLILTCLPFLLRLLWRDAMVRFSKEPTSFVFCIHLGALDRAGSQHTPAGIDLLALTYLFFNLFIFISCLFVFISVTRRPSRDENNIPSLRSRSWDIAQYPEIAYWSNSAVRGVVACTDVSYWVIQRPLLSEGSYLTVLSILMVPSDRFSDLKACPCLCVPNGELNTNKSTATHV